MSDAKKDHPLYAIIPDGTMFNEDGSVAKSAAAPDTEFKRSETKKDYQQVSMLIRKKYYKQLKKESLIKDKFIYQVLDEALAMWFNAKQ